MMLKQLLRYDYVPTYQSILCEELQFLQQGSKSVKSYYEKMQALMLRCEIDECVEATENRFLHGLLPEIQNVLIDRHYTSPSQLFELACMAEKQLLGDAIIPSSKSELLRDEHSIAPLVVPNILQVGDAQQEKEKVKIIEKDEITDVPCKDEEGNDHIAQEDTTENEKKGNEYHPISTKVENLIDGLNHSSNRAIVEQQFVDPFVGLPLSQVDLSAAPCDKYELYADASLISLPQQTNKIYVPNFDSYVSAEIKHLLPITCENDELKLLSSLNTLGYIEFNTLCDLSSLEEKIKCAELPWLSRCTYHFIGKYNCKGDYMVHRVYICSNLKFSFWCASI